MGRVGDDREPNDQLYCARTRLLSLTGSGLPMSRQELADRVNVYLYGSSRQEIASGVDAKYIGKLERGVYRWPNELYRQAFRHVLKVSTDGEIGFYVARPQRKQLVMVSSPGIDGGYSSNIMSMSNAEMMNAPDGTDWPMWFAMKLAHAISIIHNLTGEHTETLQTLLHQEILMFDASAPSGARFVFDTSRRQALITLATLPLSFGIPRGGSDVGATEMFLAHCGASLTACWHLLKGSDLETVDRLLNGYLMQLELVARKPSKYQGTAARLASQGHRVSGIIALHRNHLRAREHHCNQAVKYAELTNDIPSQVSALISLASTYFYESDPVRAAHTYERALIFDAGMSPLQRSRTRAELSVVYGQLGQERQTLESAELAEALFPDQPEHDPSYLYAEFTRASLTLEQGLAFAALAQRCPTRGYQQTAADVFSRIEQASPSAVPARIKYEIINHQASTAVLLGDMDAFAGYLHQGVEGALLLGSKQRRKEIHTAWRLAADTWPNEPRLKALGQDVIPTLTAD